MRSDLGADPAFVASATEPVSRLGLSVSIRALAERCEQATGPDRELDAEIMDTLGIGAYRTKNGLLGYPLEAKPYTRSIDAAMTLVPEGCWWEVDSNGLASAGQMDVVQGDSATPALALCAAALKARAASCD